MDFVTQATDGPSGNTHHAMTSERFAREDAARREWLNQRIHQERCKYCHRRLTDHQSRRTPGVCSNKDCRQKAKEGK